MRKLAILITIPFMLLATSCDDFLSEVPRDEYSYDDIWSTEADVTLFLNTLYRSINGFSNDGSGFTNRSEIVYNNYTDQAYNRLVNKSTDLDFTPTSTVVGDDYAIRYDAIRLCNEFILNAPLADIEETLLSRFLAEARFIRAFHYDRLNFIYGDVPLLKEPTGVYDFVYRTKKDVVFDFVTSELTEIAQSLPWQYDGNNVGRITKGAALGLKARHLLNGLGWRSDKSELYRMAREATEEIYKNGPYSLDAGVDGFQKLFTMAMENGGASGVIWTSNYDVIGRNHNYQRCVLPKGAFSGDRQNNSNYIGATDVLVESFQMLNGKDVTDPASGYDPANPWNNRDPRLDITVLRAGAIMPKLGGDGNNDVFTYDPHPKTKPADGVTTDDIGKAVNKTGYSFQKYVHFDFFTSQEDGQDYIMMRYAEVILMYAEAILGETGDIGKAMSLVNEVRARVGMPTVEDSYGSVSSTEMALDVILKERFFEFALEGPQRYFDIKRHRLAEKLFGGNNANVYGIPLGPNRVPDAKVLPGDLNDDVKVLAGVRNLNPDTYYWWPVPQVAINSNPNLLEDPID